MAAMLCSRGRFEERPRVGTVAHRTLARGCARRSGKKMAHLVFAMSSWNPGGTYDLPLLSVLSDSWTIQKNLTRRNSFICRCGIFFLSPGYFWARRVLDEASSSPRTNTPVANRRTRCQINVFVGVWPSSAWAWLREAHWKERARIDAAPGPERKAFDTEEWLRERTELLRRGTARSQAVASPSSACLIWFQVESDESRGRLTSSIARHRRPLKVEHHGVLGVQRSEPGAGRRTTPFPRTRTPRALPTRAARGWREI